MKIKQNDSPNQDLIVGIDLGTSQSSIVTSTGRMLNISSVVGFPKDFIALKLLNKSVVFGDECLRNRMSVEMIYPLKNGVIAAHSTNVDHIKKENAAREYIKHLISLTGKSNGQKLNVVIGTPANSKSEDKQAIMDTVKGLVDGVLVVSEPFLVAYGMGVFGFAIIVDIGAGTLDVCRMRGALPGKEDQRSYLKAGNFIDEMLYKLLKAKIPNGHITMQLVKEIKQKHAFVGQINEKIVVGFNVDGKTVEYDITEEIRESVSSIIPNIINSIKDLISSFDLEYQKELRENIILAGCGSKISGLPAALKKDLADFGEVNIKIIEDPIYAGAIGGLKLAQDMPVSEWDNM